MASSIQATLQSELQVTGMNCANCARHVTEALRSVAGVASAEVSLQEGRARVRWKPSASPNVSALAAAVHAAGYEAKMAAGENEPPSVSTSSVWGASVLVGLLGTTPLMVGEWVFGLGMETWFHWVAFALAFPVQVFCGARFYKGAWRQLKVGASNMDTLVALGSTAAFGYSLWALLWGAGGHLYFMEAAAIITLISVGHWLEARVTGQAENSLRDLLRLVPLTARRRNSDGAESDIPVRELRSGDRIVLRPGDRVPTDGELLEGQCSIDEAMLTGESAPVEKQTGSHLYAGTVNANGHAVMLVTAIGEATAMAHIIAAVERAQNSRANIQRLADRASNVFVPVVVAIAIGAALWWGLAFGQAHRCSTLLGRFLWHPTLPETPLAAAILSAVAVLIVACPCAMGLATPVAIMAGANAAARRGILIRDGIALEKAGVITMLLADKTGTLTWGKPTVVATEGADLALAASLAAGSKHPLSQAVAKLSLERESFLSWREISGSGVEAELPGAVTARLGSLSWLKSCGVNFPDPNGFVDKWTATGATILGLAAGSKLITLIALQDTLKPAATAVVRKLREGGLKVFMVTGDNPRTAHAIARQAGIAAEYVLAEIRPEGKARIIREFQDSGEKVAFVGDGLNDAPALQQADLGIAVSQASDVAGAAADIILLNTEIQAIPESLALARATLRTIKQNLFWAFFYNAAGVPLAALGFLSPILCAAAMGLSDLVVIGNALRLARTCPPGDSLLTKRAE
ncbi:MAG: heavy metal translocating P-type ATPase [Limisphaerales bacterium]